MEMNKMISLKVPQIHIGENGVIPTLRECFGYYDADEIGLDAPLVGYAGEYEESPGVKKNYVGKKFYNFAMAEQWPHVMMQWAKVLIGKYNDTHKLKKCVFLGAPVGGMSFAQALVAVQSHGSARYVFAEKKATELATAGQREKSKLVMGRHILLSGDEGWLTEDVVNNYSTTRKGLVLFDTGDAIMRGIVCVINRSNEEEWNTLPVLSVLYLPTEQFRQDDPQVENKIRKGNIIWKPKDVWMQKIYPRLAWRI